jgi:hypothetical protein
VQCARNFGDYCGNGWGFRPALEFEQFLKMRARLSPGYRTPVSRIAVMSALTWKWLYFDFALAAAFARRTSFTAAPATAMNIMKSTKPYEYHTLP